MDLSSDSTFAVKGDYKQRICRCVDKMMSIIKWIFFDIGSTLVDESVAFRKRVEKTIANTNVSYDDFYSKMVEISKYNQNGYHKALEYYGLTMAPWNSDDEFVYPEAKNV